MFHLEAIMNKKKKKKKKKKNVWQIWLIKHG